MPDESRNRTPDTASDMESNLGDALSPTEGITPFDSQVRITFHCTRKRLSDVDNLCGKAAIDGIVKAGLLADDSAKQVEEVRYRQVKGRTESTRIVIEEV